MGTKYDAGTKKSNGNDCNSITKALIGTGIQFLGWLKVYLFVNKKTVRGKIKNTGESIRIVSRPAW